MAATQRLNWESDGLDWPHRDASRFVTAAGLRWHVQQFGPPSSIAIAESTESVTATADTAAARPVALLIHGTGASTHSWRGLAPLLAAHFNVLALDLPGHGFTDMPVGGPTSAQLSLPGMAGAIARLLQTLGLRPALVVGHSAGAAIGVRMCLDGAIAPHTLLSLNGAFLPLGGVVGQLFSPVARLMAAAPFVPQLFSWRAADPAVLQRLMDGTGSTLDSTGMALYGKLVSNPGHAAGALGMMANWDLPQLAHDLYRLKTPIHLVVGSNDRTIAPRQASRVVALLPPAVRRPVIPLPGLGHLAHEEQPERVLNVILKAFADESPSVGSN